MDAAGIRADEALRRLIAGNERFVRGEVSFSDLRKENLLDLSLGQRPFATILGCSDSRVPPELVFNAGLGELFVARVAGNVFSSEIAATLQYAGAHLGTELFVVLGHEGCGAVEAALHTLDDGPRHHSRIQLLVEKILPGLGEFESNLSAAVRLSEAVERNVRWTIAQIRATREALAREVAGRLKLVGGIYEIASGRVRFLDTQ